MPLVGLAAQQVLEQADAVRIEADRRLIDDQHLGSCTSAEANTVRCLMPCE